MGNMIDLMNTIRENASEEYQSRVPEATRENIASVANPITTYNTVQNEFLSTLINRIALTMVRSKIATNPLSILKQGTVPLGSDIQEIITNPAKAVKFDGSGADLLAQYKPESFAMYHRRNRQDQYPVTVSREQLTAAFTSWGDLEKLISSIVNSLYSGDNIDEFILMKNLMADAVKNNKIKTVGVDALSDSGATTKLVKAIKNASAYMVFPSGNFNKFKEAQAALVPPIPVNDVITFTPVDDQILILRADVATEIDVDVLAAAFNLDKVTFLSRTVTVDSFGDAGNCLAILADKSYFQIYDSLQEMSEFYNAKGLSWTYYWNHWQTYSLSYFANAVAFVVADSKAITSYKFDALNVSGTINETTKAIAVTVPADTNVTALVPSIVHDGKSISPLSGVADDFTTPVEYVVTAADGTTATYTVTVTVAE